MAADCALELKKHSVAFVSLWPGLVRTEHMENFSGSIAPDKVAGPDAKVCIVYSLYIFGLNVIQMPVHITL
jgi:hypothetical protein